MTRFATIALAGKPNAGKSTLLNAILETKLAITSPKPQSTRFPVQGVLTEGDTQLVFIDPPGLLEPSYLMQDAMLEEAHRALLGSQAILYLHPANEGPPEPLTTLVPGLPASMPVATVITKIDLSTPPDGAVTGDVTFAISAVTGSGLKQLLTWCRAQAADAPFRYAADDLSTQPIRFFVAEFVREAAFETLEEELPYSVAAEVDEFREGSAPVYIRVVLHVERESQKGMVIGKDGRTIKQLGASARAKIEQMLGAQVYLDLWVKVLPKWRSKPRALQMLGFPTAPRAKRS